ncbi:hypothetical protein, partial [Streptococcus anginosus]|uniref:hypothetical protein n=1 Tax=Streptococcus anginosus TaxID=1328 RepID=UPI002FF017AF
KDDVITFEELGVDKLFIDEAHNYKNLYLYTKIGSIRSIGGLPTTNIIEPKLLAIAWELFSRPTVFSIFQIGPADCTKGC